MAFVFHEKKESGLIMKTFQYTITDEIGIHARPAGELAKLAKEFQSKITVKTEKKQADAEKLMAVMALGIRHGETVTVEIDGADENEAAEAVREFFQAKL